MGDRARRHRSLPYVTTIPVWQPEKNVGRLGRSGERASGTRCRKGLYLVAAGEQTTPTQEISPVSVLSAPSNGFSLVLPVGISSFSLSDSGKGVSSPIIFRPLAQFLQPFLWNARDANGSADWLVQVPQEERGGHHQEAYAKLHFGSNQRAFQVEEMERENH